MKKVMIVDDNYLSTEGIIKNINWERLDAEVTHVENNGESAIEAIKEDPVDLIISDIEMPDLDGISMSSQAIAINPMVKIILISAYDKFEYAKRAIRLGVCDYIEKPLDYGYLTEKIEHAFRTIDRENRNMELLKQSRPVLTEKFLLDLLQENFSVFDTVYFVKEFSGIICILAQNTNNPNHFFQVIHKIVSTFIDTYKNGVLQLNFGIGTIVDSVWNLHISFENASHALKYRFFFPHQNIFDAKEAMGKEFSLLSFSDSREEELIQLICQKNTQAIEQWLHNFFQELSQKCYTKNILFIRIYSLLGRILKFLYELNIDTSDLENKIISVYNQFDQFSTYEQFYQWMNDLCILVCQKLDTSLNSYHNQLCELVQSYIIENFEDNALCLNDIAKHANVSPAYLSALYKKNCGQSISDTISSCRIDKACQYLTKSNLSLKEISTRCGYTNQYYFSNSFKKKLGVSPSVYREQNTQLSPS